MRPLELLDAAAEAFAADPDAVAHVEAMVRRQDEPLRVAVAGMTRCGKSTLLHALIAADLSFRRRTVRVAAADHRLPIRTRAARADDLDGRSIRRPRPRPTG